MLIEHTPFFKYPYTLLNYYKTPAPMYASHMDALTPFHDLGRQAIKLYAHNKDPLTLDAAVLLFQISALPPNAAQTNAETLIRRQLEAFSAVFSDPL